MDMLEIIEKRRSVRTFNGEQIKEEDLKKIVEYANEVENPYGLSITWKVLDPNKYGLRSPVIVDAPCFIAGKIAKAPHAEEAFGYSFEKLLLFANSLGIGSVWIAGTLNRPAFEQAMELAQGEAMPSVSPLGYEAKKMSFRETMMRKAINADSRMDFGELFFDESFDKPLSVEKAGDLARALESVRLSPSAVNKQPWRAVLIKDKVAFYEKQSGGYVSNDGWDLQKVDVGIALSHFAIAAKALGKKVAFEIDEPKINTPRDVYYIATYKIEE